MTKLAENIRKPWLNATLKEIKNLINKQTFMIENPKDGEPVTPSMDVYKVKNPIRWKPGYTQIKDCSERGFSK